MVIRIGGNYRSTQQKHIGYVARVLRVTGTKVFFEVVHGPSRSLGMRHWMTISSFCQCYGRAARGA